MPCYEFRHRVGFEETNLVGNVYYANHVLWQGRCREMFLYEHCPEVVEEFRSGLALVTVHVSCHYFRELSAFDEVVLRMRAGAVSAGRVTMLFEYARSLPGGGEELVARGEQEVACLRRQGSTMVPEALPEALRAALRAYADAPAGAAP